MGAVGFGREWDERVTKANENLDDSLRKLFARTCPTDGVQLRKNGQCPVCGRNIKILEESRKQEAQEARSRRLSPKPDIIDEDDEMPDAEKKFWARLERQRLEGSTTTPKTETPSRGDLVRQNPGKYLRY